MHTIGSTHTCRRRALVASLVATAALGAGAIQASSAEATLNIQQTFGEQLKITDGPGNDLTIGGNEDVTSRSRTRTHGACRPSKQQFAMNASPTCA